MLDEIGLEVTGMEDVAAAHEKTGRTVFWLAVKTRGPLIVFDATLNHQQSLLFNVCVTSGHLE